MRCAECGREIGDGQNFCKYCGAQVRQNPDFAGSAAQISKCKACGAVLKPADIFCTQCGNPVPGFEDTAPVMSEQGKKKSGKCGKFLLMLFMAAALEFGLLFGYYFAEHHGGFDRYQAVDEQEAIGEDGGLEKKFEGDKKPEIAEEPEVAVTSNSDDRFEEDEVAQMIEESEKEAVNDRFEEERDEGSPENQYDAPRISIEHISYAEATSYLDESKYNIIHLPERAIDRDLTTGWVEGATGQGIGESITVYFDGMYSVSYIEIFAGFQKSDELYYKNSRPKDVYVEFSDGTGESHTLFDLNSEQDILLEKPVVTDRITLRIDSVYPGDKYEDTVITEITPY